MKRLFLLGSILLIAIPAHAQTNAFPSSGNVGIGTTSPAGILEVDTAKNTDTGQPRFLSQSSTAGDWNEIMLGATTGAYEWTGFRFFNGQGTASSAYLNIFVGGVSGGQLVVAGTGNVGIGTTSPANTLDVYGTGIHIQSGVPSPTSMELYNNSGTLTWNGTALATGSSVSGTTNYIPYFTGSSSLGNSVLYQSSSKIGIGTTSPAVSLDVGFNNDAVGLPSGTTAQRPSGANGQIRYNSSTQAVEAYVNGGWISLSSPAGNISSGGQLQCSGGNCGNSTGSGTIQYCPYKGNIKTTASQGNYTIPSACLTATLTSMYVGGTGSSSVTASTLYYIYLWDTSGTWVLDAETTGHATDTSSGIEIMSGDNTKTLVGMIHTDANKHVMTGGQTSVAGDTDTVATWDNRKPTRTQCSFTAGRTVTSTSLVEINTENRCNFMSWGDAAIFASQQQVTQTVSGTGGNITTQLIPDNNFGAIQATITPPGAGNVYYMEAMPPSGVAYPPEGFHYTTMQGAVSAGGGGTATYPALDLTMVYTVQ